MTRPPRPPGLMLYNVLRFGADPLRFLLETPRYGDVVWLRVPPKRDIYLVQHPELVEPILVSDHARFIKDKFTKALDDALGNGLLLSEGTFWKRQRKLAQPAFHRQRIAGYAEVMVRQAEAELERWPNSAEIDVHAEMMSVTSEIVAEALFGASVGGEARAVSDAIGVVMDRYLGIFGTGVPVPLSLPTPGNRRFKRAVARLDETLFRFIEAGKRKLRDDPARADLLSMLLNARDDSGAGMSDQQLRDECLTLFVAGHETTALSLSYAMLLLAEHPQYQTKLRAELETVCGERAAGYDDYPKLELLRAVVNESLRLYPPAWAIGREALEPVQVGGFDAPAGTELAISPIALHRDPRFWDRPEAFRPERWLDGSTTDLPRFAFMPFGGGPRVCIGNSFALLEACLVLACIVRRYDLARSAGTRIALVHSVTLRPRYGVRLQVTRSPRSAALDQPSASIQG